MNNTQVYIEQLSTEKAQRLHNMFTALQDQLLGQGVNPITTDHEKQIIIEGVAFFEELKKDFKRYYPNIEE